MGNIKKIHPIILCGGSGARLWPVSRKSFPKQFVSLAGKLSLFQQSASRYIADLYEAPVVISASEFRFIVMEQLAGVQLLPSQVLLEPSQRNTAAAICAAALSVHENYGDSLILVSPADHIIPDSAHFKQTIERAIPSASSGQLVTFGIKPTRPETGYGWIKLTNPIGNETSHNVQAIDSFIEKPEFKLAEELFESQKYLWNSGIFLFSTKTILETFKKYELEIFKNVQKSLKLSTKDLSFTRLAPEPWEKLNSISIDYSIFEKAKNIAVAPFFGSWTDLGDWEAILQHEIKDEDGVVVVGNAKVTDAKNSLVYAQDKKQIVVGLGIKDLYVVSMSDAVLVADKKYAQKVKDVVKDLKLLDVSQAENHPFEYRPWGWFETLISGEKFHVKRIVVNPGHSLSLQSHKYRSEHWVVVEGVAEVTINQKVKLLSENQSIYLPVGSIHRLKNPEKKQLSIIEVQTGTYFGEDDITRYDDIYKR